MPGRIVTKFLFWEFENIDLDCLLLARSYEGIHTHADKDLYNYKNALLIMEAKMPEIFADRDTTLIEHILRDLDIALKETYTETWAKEIFFKPQSVCGKECYEGFRHRFMRSARIRIGTVAPLDQIPKGVFNHIRAGFLHGLSAAEVTLAINILYPKERSQIPYQIQPFTEEIVQLIDCYLRFSDDEKYEAWRAHDWGLKNEPKAVHEAP